MADSNRKTVADSVGSVPAGAPHLDLRLERLGNSGDVRDEELPVGRERCLHGDRERQRGFEQHVDGLGDDTLVEEALRGERAG